MHVLSLAWRVIRRSFGIDRDPSQVFFDDRETPKVLLVAPGETAIPVKGWGAVEGLVWRQRNEFQQRGIPADILNSWKITNWIRSAQRRPSAIICHYDDLLIPTLLIGRILKARVIAVSHYPFAHRKELWNPGFLLYSKLLKYVDVYVALAPKIQTVLSGTCSKIVTIHNSVDACSIRFSEMGSRGIVYVGKVDSRKRQVEVSQVLDEMPISIIGPWNDERPISELVKTTSYLGEWSHEELLDNLTEFSGLILASRSEADALVIHEARVAGLHVFATESALGSHLSKMPGISMISEDLSNLRDLVEDFNETVDSRIEIRNSALEHSSEARAMEKWCNLIREILDS